MQFQIIYIEFDFDDEMSAYDKDKLTSETIGEIFEAEDDEQLIDQITESTGWCIKSIDYRKV